MATVKMCINIDTWTKAAIDEFRKESNMLFAEAMRFLLESELNGRGYYRADYEPNVAQKKKKT